MMHNPNLFFPQLSKHLPAPPLHTGGDLARIPSDPNLTPGPDIEEGLKVESEKEGDLGALYHLFTGSYLNILLLCVPLGRPLTLIPLIHPIDSSNILLFLDHL